MGIIFNVKLLLFPRTYEMTATSKNKLIQHKNTRFNFKLNFWRHKIRHTIKGQGYSPAEESNQSTSLNARHARQSFTEVTVISENIRRMERSRPASHVVSFRFVGTCHKRSKNSMKMGDIKTCKPCICVSAV